MAQTRSRASSAESRPENAQTEIVSVLTEIDEIAETQRFRAPSPSLENEDPASSSITVQPRLMKRKNPVDSNDEEDTTPSESLSDPTIGADVRKLVAGLAEQRFFLDALKTDNNILRTRVRSLEKSCEGGFKELTLWVRVVAKELLEMREEQKRTPVEAPMDLA